MTEHAIQPGSSLSARDFIRADRQRLRHIVGAASDDIRRRLLTEIDAVITPIRIGQGAAPTARDGLQSVEEHLRGQIAGLREAMTVMAARPAVRVDALADGTAEPQLREEAAAPWPDLIESFFAGRPSLGDSSQVSHRHAFVELEAQIGRKPVAAVTKADIARYVEWLEGKDNGPSGRKGHTHLSRDTIVKKLQHVRSLFAWAVEKAYAPVNPAEGVGVRTATREERDGEDDRRAFTNEELVTLFASPLFTGFANPRSRSQPGLLCLRDERFWFFPVALMTGARVDELAQAPSALFVLDGIPCLDLRKAGTKTNNAPRVVPILPELVQAGFVAWAAAKEKRGEPFLFQGGASSSDWSKWTNRYLDDIGLDDLNTATYSLRHNFRQMLRAAGLSDELADKVFGHGKRAGRGRTGARYGRALAPDEARRVVETVRAPIALRHLSDRTTCYGSIEGPAR
jgi:integrase